MVHTQLNYPNQISNPANYHQQLYQPPNTLTTDLLNLIGQPSGQVAVPTSQGSLEAGKKKEEADRYSALEERLRAIEGLKTYGSINPVELCLVLGVTIPKKFKVPKFEKYNGTTNPKMHIITYYRGMMEVANDDKLPIHFFHRSLTGVALKWYMQLDSSRIKTWKDLVDAFIR